MPIKPQAQLLAKLESEVYPRFFSAFSALLHAHGDGFFYGDQVGGESGGDMNQGGGEMDD
jgi:hypothetical protein